MKREDKYEGSSERPFKKSRCERSSSTATSASLYPTLAHVAAEPAQFGCDEPRVSEKEIVALLIQKLWECELDAAKASAIMDVYRGLGSSESSRQLSNTHSYYRCGGERSAARALPRRDRDPSRAAWRLRRHEILGACDCMLLRPPGDRAIPCESRRPYQSSRGRVSPVFFAARQGHLKVLQWLSDNGARIDDDCADTENTPLMIAVASGRAVAMRLLVADGADTTLLRQPPGLDLLSIAAMNGHLGTLKHLVENDIGKCNEGESEWCALEAAVGYQQTEIVCYLVQQEELSRENASACLERSSFLRYLPCLGNADIAEMMIFHGADVDTVEENAIQTPLDMAVEAGMDAVVELLLPKGAAFRSAVDFRFELNALHLMARLGRFQMLQSVLQSSDTGIDFADFEVTDFYDHMRDQTPLSLAAKHGHAEVVKFLFNSAPAPRNAEIDENCLHNTLRSAAKGGYVDTLRILISRGARIKVPDEFTSALSDAAGGSISMQSSFSVRVEQMWTLIVVNTKQHCAKVLVADTSRWCGTWLKNVTQTYRCVYFQSWYWVNFVYQVKNLSDSTAC